MNVTFLIGNGFDKNLGLKTCFSEFLPDYLSIDVDHGSVLECFKKDILKDAALWSEAERAFGEYTMQYSGTEGANDYLLCHEDFCYQLGRYLERQEARIDYAGKSTLICDAFSSALGDLGIGFREVQRETINKYIDTCSEGFVYEFVVFNYTMTVDNCVTSVKGNAKKLGQRKRGATTYTNRIGEVLHVHGYTDHDMVLGVNDDSQIDNLELFSETPEEDKAQIVKRDANRMYERNTDERVLALLERSNLIYIYGMSLGDTDAIWWKRICELMTKRTSLRLIIHQHDAPDEGFFVRNFRRYERETRESFCRFFTGSDTEKASIMQRIHITKGNLFAELKDLVETPTAIAVGAEADLSATEI